MRVFELTTENSAELPELDVVDSIAPSLQRSTPEIPLTAGSYRPSQRRRIEELTETSFERVEILKCSEAIVWDRWRITIRDEVYLAGAFLGLGGGQTNEELPIELEQRYLDAEAVVFEGSAAVLSLPANADQIYGHWLLDLLPTVLLLEQHNPPDAYFLLSDSPDFAQSLLQFASVDEDRIKYFEARKHKLLPETLILASSVRTAGKCHTGVINNCFDTLGGAQTSHPTRRIFVARKENRSARRDLLNRSIAEDIFRARGFEIIYPEDLEFSEQVQLFRDTALLAGESGSGLHNSLMMPYGASCIELHSSADDNFLQANICSGRHQRLHVFFGEALAKSAADRTADWIVDAPHLERWLSELVDP